MQTFGWLEMPHFLIRISSYIPSEIEKHDFLSYYFSQQKGEVYTEDGLPSAQWEIMVLVTEDGHEVLCW